VKYVCPCVGLTLRVKSLSIGWSGEHEIRPTCSSDFTNAAKSENAVGVGLLTAASGDTWLASRRAEPFDRAMLAWMLVRDSQMGLSSASKVVMSHSNALRCFSMKASSDMGGRPPIVSITSLVPAKTPARAEICDMFTTASRPASRAAWAK
jgi:hypothetical protein